MVSLKSLPPALLLLALVACTGSPQEAASETPLPLPEVVATPEPPPPVKMVESEGPAGKVYLTFDDGPSEWTGKVREVLLQEEVPATFFVLGPQVEKHAPLVRTLVEEGMSVQVHSWAHKSYVKLSSEQVQEDIARTSQAVEAASGTAPTCLRPPYGALNKRVRGVLGESGLKTILWQSDSEDWRRPGVARIKKNVWQHVAPEVVILFHDGGGPRGQTVEAVRELIPELKEAGYGFGVLCK